MMVIIFEFRFGNFRTTNILESYIYFSSLDREKDSNNEFSVSLYETF
jgi:hypothetical protein